MNGLNKDFPVIDRELPGCAHETLLVLDATTGQNGLIRPNSSVRLRGHRHCTTIWTALAKGGITVAIANELQIPVKYIGLGEGCGGPASFDAEGFTEALV